MLADGFLHASPQRVGERGFCMVCKVVIRQCLKNQRRTRKIMSPVKANAKACAHPGYDPIAFIKQQFSF